jgi:ArsR family transcriptional regulator, virulence genes transcriptional regulator
MDAANRTQSAAASAGIAAKMKKRKQETKAGSDLQQLTKQAAAAARMLKLIGNERRLLVLCFLAANGEMRAGDLTSVTGLSQSALSQHLAKMRADGLVAFRRQSQTLHYRIADPRAEQLLKSLKSIYCSGLSQPPRRRR